MKFSDREYLWDRVRQGPCIVIGVHSETCRYTVAEIVGSPPKLGRVASRDEEQLCRYVKAIIPEDEAREAQKSLELNSMHEHSPVERAARRIEEARIKRGVT